MSDKPAKKLTEEPQQERGEVGSRGVGSPGPSDGPADRPIGSFDAEEMQSGDAGGGTATTGDQSGAEFTTATPKDVQPPVPPYEGRQT